MQTKADLEAIERLNRDMRMASSRLADEEVRYLVDAYYDIQEQRKAFDHRSLQLSERGTPTVLMSWLADQARTLEANIKKALDNYTDGTEVGSRIKAIPGIGPITAAGLLAYIDITRAPTAGHVWSYAGLEGTKVWTNKREVNKVLSSYRQTEADDWTAFVKTCRALGRRPGQILAATGHIPEEPDAEAAKHHLGAGTYPQISFAADNLFWHVGATYEEMGRFYGVERLDFDKIATFLSRRPHNAKLKTLCWLLGESFVKVRNREGDVYGTLIADRKAYEQQQNDAGAYADLAADKLRRYNIGRGTEAYKWYSAGKLPPAHIQERAKRWGVKMFLSHVHELWYELEYGERPVEPYALAQLGHTHKVERPF